MSQSIYALCTVGLFLILLASPGSTQATTIQFTAAALNDTLGPGGDLWQYRYVVSGFAFPMNDDFSILFSPNLYRDLENPPPPVTDWDVLTLQPDPALPADGLYDALALVDNASLANAFTVRFVWLGGSGTTPGTQPYQDIGGVNRQSLDRRWPTEQKQANHKPPNHQCRERQ